MIELDQLKSDEGFRSGLYHCTSGKLTIGYGFNVEAGISEKSAEALLMIRISQLETKLSKSLSWYDDLSDNVKGVLINMAYQLGIRGMMRFTNTLYYIHHGEWSKAAVEILDSRAARQTPNRFIRHAERLKNELC